MNVGVDVEFMKNRAILTKDGKIIGEATKQGNLFYLTMDVEIVGTALTTDDGVSKHDLWHKR